jgi:enoyl-CoA hydratase/carnithine racemase
VDPGVAAAAAGAVRLLAQMGHEIREVDLPLEGWIEAFGPLVLADEWEHRGHLLADGDALTGYARRSIQAAARITDADVDAARRRMAEFRARIDGLFADYDLIVTPATAATAFPIGERPGQIDGQDVDALWGPFPFTAPFNVAGTPAASLPCGLADGLPVGLQLVGPKGAEALLLDVCEELEEALAFPIERMAERWDTASPAAFRDGEVAVERRGSTAIVRISRPAKRNALTLDLLERLRGAFASDAVRGAAATVLTGEPDVFSAGADLTQVGNGIGDLAMDEAVAAAADAIRSSPAPVIAALEGPCMGAAVELAVACDVLVAGRGSIVALPATRLGILYRPAALRDLVGRLGHQTVARLVLLGEVIDGPSALSAGIVSDVVDDGGAVAAAVDLAAGAAPGLRRATTATKALLVAIERNGSAHELAEWEAVRRDLLEDRGRQAVAALAPAPTPVDTQA